MQVKVHLIRFYIFQFSNEIYQKLPLAERSKIKNYLLNFLVTFPSNENEMKESQYFVKHELETFKTQKIDNKSVHLSKIALQNDWVIPDAKHHRSIKLGDLERKLVACSTGKQVRKLLVELAKCNPVVSPV